MYHSDYGAGGQVKVCYEVKRNEGQLVQDRIPV